MRLRDLLPRVMPHHATRIVRDAHDDPLAVLNASGWDHQRHPFRSPLCAADDPVSHARCRHAANRARYDGCSCPCHDGGAR